MARSRKDLGARRNVRVELRRPGFLIPAPDAAWNGDDYSALAHLLSEDVALLGADIVANLPK